MFTGIIETLGEVTALKQEQGNLHITIKSPISAALKIDQSVAHNGVCLTVVALDHELHTVTAIEETLQKTKVIKRAKTFKSPLSESTPCKYLGIDKITMHEQYTQIDFVYIAPKKYINGGWIQIDSASYIQPVNSETRYPLLEARNISIAPTKLHFNGAGQVHRYSLIFPALPKNVNHINIIEKLAEGSYFNFFNVALQHNTPTVIRMINEN